MEDPLDFCSLRICDSDGDVRCNWNDTAWSEYLGPYMTTFYLYGKSVQTVEQCEHTRYTYIVWWRKDAPFCLHYMSKFLSKPNEVVFVLGILLPEEEKMLENFSK